MILTSPIHFSTTAMRIGFWTPKSDVKRRCVPCSFGGTCVVARNVVCLLTLQRLCAASMLLVWCYDRSAAHASVLPMSCFVSITAVSCGCGVAGVVIRLQAVHVPVLALACVR